LHNKSGNDWKFRPEGGVKRFCLIVGITAGLTIYPISPAFAATSAPSPAAALAVAAADPVRVNREWFTYSACESIGKWYVSNGAAAYSVEEGWKYGYDEFPWVVRVLD
jgi:hypothetical protein